MLESDQPLENQHHADQLVVATPHVGLAQDALSRRGVTSSVMDESRPLGLTLLHLKLSEVERAASAYQGPELRARLDRLLNLMYDDVKQRYGGWIPDWGKHRRVVSAHNIGGGGVLPPVAASKEDRLPQRGGDPGRGVRVGIADTALYAHPWLAGAYKAAPASIWASNGEPADYAVGHATFIAGLILQQAPGATLDVRPVLEDSATADGWDVAKKLVGFAGSGIDILNLSFATPTMDDRGSFLLETALSRIDPGVVVVAAAGNYSATDNHQRPLWPAALPRVLAVGAVDEHGSTPSWSPDPTLPWIDLVTYGTDLVSTFPCGDLTLPGDGHLKVDGDMPLARWSGTSFSAASTTGRIAALTVPGQVSAATALELLVQRLPRNGLAAPMLH